jgi:hypothetical protein
LDSISGRAGISQLGLSASTSMEGEFIEESVRMAETLAVRMDAGDYSVARGAFIRLDPGDCVNVLLFSFTALEYTDDGPIRT